MYNGAISNVQPYFDAQGCRMPLYMNPAEFVLDLVNTDFTHDRVNSDAALAKLHRAYMDSESATVVGREIAGAKTRGEGQHSALSDGQDSASSLTVILALIHRSFIKSYRDIIAYGIRIAMYMGLAIMMGTVWLRMGETQNHIQSFINAIVSQTNIYATSYHH